MNELEKVKRWLDHLADTRFYGSFATTWENGHLVHTRQETSRKPADLNIPSEQLKETYGTNNRPNR